MRRLFALTRFFRINSTPINGSNGNHGANYNKSIDMTGKIDAQNALIPERWTKFWEVEKCEKQKLCVFLNLTILIDKWLSVRLNVFLFAVIIPSMVSAVADVHFLRFKQVFIASSPTALYDFHIHKHTHYSQSPNLDRKLSVYCPHTSVNVMPFSLSFSYSTLHCFMILPVFDDIFRAPKR